jgi:hypothetical protein
MFVDLRHEELQSGIHNSRYGGTVIEIYFVLKITTSEGILTL